MKRNAFFAHSLVTNSQSYFKPISCPATMVEPPGPIEFRAIDLNKLCSYFVANTPDRQRWTIRTNSSTVNSFLSLTPDFTVYIHLALPLESAWISINLSIPPKSIGDSVGVGLCHLPGTLNSSVARPGLLPTSPHKDLFQETTVTP